jgi:sulfur relay (sulfurtransferase) complex TusBCD TusD component (DsrE family)
LSEENNQKCLGILFFSGPYQTEAPETACKIATAALDKGYKVQMFLYMDAANCVLEDQKEIEGIFNIGKAFEQLVERGVLIRVCNLCLAVRGTAKNMMKRSSDLGGKIKRAGTPDLSKIIEETDKFLVINS